MNLRIRRALPEEAGLLSQIAFSAKAHWGYPKRWMELWKPQLSFSPEHLEQNEGWVAVIDDIPLAFYILQEKAGNAWLDDLWVSPDFIGRGIGKKLFFHAVERSRQRGYRRLQLEADPHAVGFYEKMGMVRIGERHSEVENEPRILPIMEISL